MPQRKQIFIQNGYYHIFNRGHNKQSIFLSYKDYIRYLQRMEDYLKKHAVTLLCYCLMPNHIHLILRQDSDESIEKFIHRLHTSYTMYFNKKYERVGAVFQGRFKAKFVDTDEYLVYVSRYIHQNPLEILRSKGRQAQDSTLSLEKYPWSSYLEYIGLSTHKLSSTKCILEYFSSTIGKTRQSKYKEYVEKGIERIGKSTLEKISAGDIEIDESFLLKARP